MTRNEAGCAILILATMALVGWGLLSAAKEGGDPTEATVEMVASDTVRLEFQRGPWTVNLGPGDTVVMHEEPVVHVLRRIREIERRLDMLTQ